MLKEIRTAIKRQKAIGYPLLCVPAGIYRPVPAGKSSGLKATK